MLRLTRSTDYMLRVVLYLARQEAAAVVSRREIVEAMEIPDAYFRKIATQLGKAGVLRVSQGALGGCSLARPPEELTLLEVVEAGAGEISINECVLYPDVCHRTPACAVHEIWETLRDQVRDTLREVTFADLAERESGAGALRVPRKPCRARKRKVRRRPEAAVR